MDESNGNDLHQIAVQAKSLAHFVWEQLRRQEGSWIGTAQYCVVFLDGEAFAVWWEEDQEIRIEPTDQFNEEKPSLRQFHHPMLNMSEATDRAIPFRVPYSCSAGFLAGRTGELTVWKNGQIEDGVTMMS